MALVTVTGPVGLWTYTSPWDSAARRRFERYPLRVLNAFITRDNICELLAKGEAPTEPDLLSIDIDGNDYWVLERLLDHYAPRVLCCEYNASYPPGSHWVMPYDEDHVWDQTGHYGSSLDAMHELGRRHDYSLVGCDPRGVNAFLVKTDLARDRFDHWNAGPLYHYTSPKYDNTFFGHPRTLAGREARTFNAAKRLWCALTS